MIQSVARAVALLESLSAQGEVAVALGDLAGRVGLKAPTAHNLLRTLVKLGYVTHDAQTRKYALGDKALALGRRQFLTATLVEVSMPVLKELETEFGETVLLALYRDGLRHTVAVAESAQNLRVGGQTGADARLYETATGRVLLSMLERDHVERFVRERGLPGEEWPGMATTERLLAELRKILAARFVALRRAHDGIRAAAVPVPLAEPVTRAALGMYYPATRTPRGGISRVRERLTKAAETIGQAYGRRG
ncbi:MAG: helix-turn-helix domain-containing protein [Kiritimatiellae bacterium]|nr:helix-turn-helix domain-containing protein [Kiritimatiellia bacterium]